MKTKLKIILTAAIIAIGRIFALPASAAKGKGGKSGGFNFLPALCVILLFAVLTACGGGGGGSSPPAVAPVTTPSLTVTPPVEIGTGPYFYLTYDNIDVPRVEEHIARLTITAGQRWFRRYDGISVVLPDALTIITPGGSPVLTNDTSNIEVISMRISRLDYRSANLPIRGWVTLEQTVYVADFGHLTNCGGIAATENIDQGSGRTRHLDSFDRTRRVMVSCIRNGRSRVQVVIHKAQSQILPVCWRDMNRTEVRCYFGNYSVNPGISVFLAFPDQTYRHDNGECESAPFYAVSNCQSENAVDVGNFAAFVSGLDGNGYRQFGIRHRWKAEDWNAAAMVSHAKGREFLDTWWGRLRLEHSILDDGSAFAEYESGITSLRQNGFMFSDIPISGGRVGFRFDDFTASFGRPMHYKGKGKNAAAVHWQHSKETEFSFRNHNKNAEVLWQWRRRF